MGNPWIKPRRFLVACAVSVPLCVVAVCVEFLRDPIPENGWLIPSVAIPGGMAFGIVLALGVVGISEFVRRLVAGDLQRHDWVTLAWVVAVVAAPVLAMGWNPALGFLLILSYLALYAVGIVGRGALLLGRRIMAKRAEQHGGQVSSEGAPSAPPIEPSP